jgi:signal transduction histidine kinase
MSDIGLSWLSFVLIGPGPVEGCDRVDNVCRGGRRGKPGLRGRTRRTPRDIGFANGGLLQAERDRKLTVSEDASRIEGQAPERVVAGNGGGAGAIDVGRLAHELRNPLGAIAVLAEIMRDERLGPLGSDRYRGYAADILASAAQANGVLASFVEPAAASLGAGTLSFAEIDPAEVVDGTVSALVPLASCSGVGLRVAHPNALPRIIADRRCLRQMLDNLIANALKYTPPGGEIVILIGYDVGGPVRIEVTDNGDGMTPAELERARSLDAAPEPLRRRSGGTGFGLPMVRALAAACGAAISIVSEAGAGTRVTIAFAHDRVVPI